FTFSPPGRAESVTLAGSFNNWSREAQPMTLNPATGAWTVTIELMEGEYQYKFVVDGSKWFQDPAQELKAPDGFGGDNSVLRVGDYDRFRESAKRGDGKIVAEALYHEVELPFVEWSDSTRVALRLRLKKDDVDRCAVVVLSGASSESSVPAVVAAVSVFPMKWFAQDGVFEYRRAEIPTAAGGAKYVFKVEDASETLYYFADNTYSVGLESPVPFITAPADSVWFGTPDWVEGTVFYQIFPERFRNGDPSNDPAGVVAWADEPANFNFFGGDLQGVVDGLGYLDSLGIGAVYFNPVFEATSNHKYNTTDYMKIDPHFGTLETFQTLLSAAHDRGINIVLDGVFNHSGYEFWAFQDIVKNGPISRYADWYTIHGYPVVRDPKPNYESWWGYADLPKINTNNPSARQYIFDVTTYWTRDVGADGWRLDVPNEVPHEFWKEFRKVVKGVGPSKYIVGEIWDNGFPWLQGDQFDAVMNYRFRRAMMDFFAAGEANPVRLDETLGRIRIDYPDAANRVMLNLIGSHDTERFLTLCGDDVRKLKLAALFQMTYPGAPCIYYGDEIGLTGLKDPGCRKTFRWDPAQQNAELRDFYFKVVALRNNHSSLRRGDYVTLLADASRNTLAFARDDREELAVIVINNDLSKQPAEMDLSQLATLAQREVPDGTVLRDGLTGARYTVTKGRLTIPVMEPKSGLVLFATREETGTTHEGVGD
ncbi:MAG: alpha amylase N-terminal ig-like domain-containing protein, partial [Candidatus Eisenbacteria bacterium]|nr:alpha amylase N-terminal ig-like domain-containing protein [Candidatus Eisenbacteria bacterium]